MTVQTVVAIINGQEVTLTKQGDGSYTATFTAPSSTSGMNNNGVGPGVGTLASGKGYYDVAITAEDEAGNSTTINSTTGSFQDNCKLKVFETVAPVGEFSYPAAGAVIGSAQPEIKFSFTDSGSGVKPDTCFIVVDGGEPIAVELTGSGATLSGAYTPSAALANGAHTVKIYASDYDGNKSEEVTVTFTTDVAAPVLNVTGPVDGITNVPAFTIEGTTNDEFSSPVTVTATLNGADIGAITVNGDGTFSKSGTWATGANTLVVTATDALGNSTSVTRIVTLDTGAPVFESVVITENPTATGTTVTITVRVTD